MQHTFLPALADPVFSLHVAPDAAVAHPAWRRARAEALALLAAGRHVALVGAPGSGKSLLLRNLAYALRKAGEPVHLIGRADASGDALAGGILLVDEADALGTDALAILCAGAGPVLLAMLPGGAERLPRRARPIQHVMLDRLSPLEVARFIADRLAAAGRPGDFLEPEAVLALARHSGGLPRLINVFGAGAVFLAGLDGSPRIKPHHVQEAASMGEDPAEDLPLPPLQKRPPAKLFASLPSYRGAKLRRRAALSGMVATSGMFFLLPWLMSRRPGSVQQARVEGAAQVAQADVAPPPGIAAPDTAAPAVADAEAPGPANLSSASVDVPEQPSAKVQQAAVDQAPPRQAVPIRQGDPAVPATPPGDRRAVLASEAPVLFRGPIFNETMGQGGQVTVAIRKQAQAGAITARFDASQGLSGTGTLAGRVSGTGQITASGQLLMGKNPFLCDFSGTLHGNSLTGHASFVRPGNSTVYRSRFNLVRA